MKVTRRDLLGAVSLGAALGNPPAAQAGWSAPADAGRKIRLAVVGGGFGSTFHWHEHPRCVVTAVTDLYPERRARLRDAYRCDNIYDSLEEMLRRERNVDAVAVFSGAPSHYAHVEMCMKRGLHTVSAVPAVMSLEEAEKLKALKEKSGLRYMMAESSYYRPAAIYARDLYRKGGFGEIFYSEVEYYHDRPVGERLQDRKSSYYNPDGSVSWRQGFPPMHYPTHSVAFVTGVTGERIVRVSCLGVAKPETAALFTNRLYPGRIVLNESALMRTNRGNMVRCNVFWQIAAPESEQARWFGEKGSLHMAAAGFNPNTWCERGGKPGPITFPEYLNSEALPASMRHRSGHGGSAVFISAEFVNALLEDREPAIDVYEALAMTMPGIVAHQSALRDGEQLPVPQFDRKRN